MKHFLTACLVLLTPALLFAQNNKPTKNITGKIISAENQKTIPFATIAVYPVPAKEALKYEVADSLGNFAFEFHQEGNFMLVIEAMGFDKKNREFEITEEKSDFPFGEIALQPLDQQLEEVEIIAEKRLIRTESDKIIYNTEYDPDTKTTTTLEMLRKVPLISVDGDDNIRVQGSTDFKVHINGKESVMTNNNVSEFLKSLPASNVKEIEVITTPGAKYDAEGIGGIINIVTHQKMLEGYTLNANANATSLGRFSGGLSYAASLGKFVISLNGNYSHSMEQTHSSITERENFYSEDMHYLNSESESGFDGNFLWSNAALSYELDSLNLISAEFAYWKGAHNANAEGNTEILTNENILYQAYRTLNDTKYGFGNQNANIDYQKTAKRNKKQILTLSYKYNKRQHSNDTGQEIDSLLNYYNERITVDNQGQNMENTFQLDYVYPIIKGTEVAAGTKYIMRRNTSFSDKDHYNYDTRQYENIPSESIDFAHKQDIMAGYISLNGKLKKFGYKAGLRIEQSETNGVFAEQSESDFNSTTLEYVPSVSFSYELGRMKSIQLGYSKRIKRPGIWYLNPYVDDTDPKFVKYGNPNLDPEHFHSFNLNVNLFSKLGSVNLGSHYSFSDNGIGTIYTIHEGDVMHRTYENILQQEKYGISLNTNLTFFKKLSLSANVSIDYNKFQNKFDPDMNNNAWSIYSFMNLRYRITKSIKVSAYGGLYSFPGGLQEGNRQYYFTTFSLSKSFLDDKLTLTLSGNNIFWKNHEFDYQIEDEYFSQTSTRIRPARSFRFGLSFRIGDMKTRVKKASRGIRNTDVKEGEGSEGGGTGAQGEQ
jgi:hypothetical protein